MRIKLDNVQGRAVPCQACIFCFPGLAVPLISLVTLGRPLSHSWPSVSASEKAEAVLGDEATEPPTSSPESLLISSCPLPGTRPRPPFFWSFRHSVLIGEGPPPQLPLLLAPCELIGFGSQGPAVLGSFSGTINRDVIGFRDGLSGRVARPLKRQDSAQSAACRVLPGPGSPLPVVERQLPRQSWFHL